MATESNWKENVKKMVSRPHLSPPPSRGRSGRGWGIFCVLISLLLAVFGCWSCSKGDYSGRVESIEIGTLRVESAGLIYLAQDKQFFADNKLTVTIKDYNTGVATIDALLRGEVDIAWAAEFPFVRMASAKEKIRIMGVTDKFSYHYLFGRRDRGIENIADFKGKKIGLSRGTISEFYLGRYLELNGMTVKNVKVVDIAPPQLVDAITGGSVDAIVAWGPFTHQIRVRLKDNLVVLPIQSSQAGYGILIGKNEWIATHPEIVNRFLKALAHAEEYLVRQPAGAKAIVKKWMGYDDTLMEIVWSENQFSLSLDQSLVAAMEDEARWMIKNKLTSQKKIPDFMNYIYVDGLKAVKPEAVKIIR